ncbi:rRNA maturation RNase YbeY [Thioclava sp. BHET1]|nr:rRNA maturation RNase YbeY [Thioclava sp. BHET1]
MEPLVDIVIEDARWQGIDLAGLSQTAAIAVLRDRGLDPGRFTISLLGCDDARIAVLNADFRDKPRPTNVLSWPSEERAAAIPGTEPLPPEPMGPMAEELGDIAIAWETCAREAADQGKAMPDHVIHLVVHACLHLLGYDHIDDADAELMEGTETRILASLGIADPYS